MIVTVGEEAKKQHDDSTPTVGVPAVLQLVPTDTEVLGRAVVAEGDVDKLRPEYLPAKQSAEQNGDPRLVPP